MPKAATVSPDREEITVDTAQADDKKAVQRGSRPTKEKEDAEESWLDRSKAVKRRMARFGENLKSDLTRQFDQRMAEREADWQREMRKMREENEGLRRDFSSGTTDAAHQAEIQKLQDELEAAHEAGDSKKIAQIQTQISRTEAAHMQKKTEALLGKQPARDEKDGKPAADKGGEKGASTKAQRFIRATSWWDDPEFAAERGAANAIHDQLVSAGSDPESDDHYRRINKALKKKFPNLEVADPDDIYDDILGLDDDDEKGGKRSARNSDRDFEDEEEEEEEPRARRRAPVQQFNDRGNAESAGRNRTVKLDDTDIATMRAMKLDPKDDKAVRAFATAKAERLAQEG